MQKNKVSKSQITYKRQDWYTLQAKRFYIDNSFDFQVESVGVYSNLEIMQKACNILINKLKKISEMCDAENPESSDPKRHRKMFDKEPPTALVLREIRNFLK